MPAPDGRKDHHPRCLRRAAALPARGLERPGPGHLRPGRADGPLPGVFPQVGYAIGRHCGTAVVRNSPPPPGPRGGPCRGPRLPRGPYLRPPRPRLRPPLTGRVPGRRGRGPAAGLPEPRSARCTRVTPNDGSAPDPQPRPVQRGPARIALLKAYQGAASGRVSTCRFYPSCSNYAVEAFSVHGFWRALGLTARRLLRCRPFGPHGVDLVPSRAARPPTTKPARSRLTMLTHPLLAENPVRADREDLSPAASSSSGGSWPACTPSGPTTGSPSPA